jgi:pimeloyl-ACP methyl ester carboxylesterase
MTLDQRLAAAKTPAEKRTTGRLRPLQFPGWLRLGFRVGSRVAPELAARVTRRLFFRPPPVRRRGEQAEALQRGARFDLRTERGGRVAGWSWGDGGDRPPVLLLHGWGGHAGQFASFLSPLEDRGFRVLALDLPAHGDSSGSEASIRHFAEAIEEAARVFGPFSGIVAHSFGCAATTYALARGLEVDRVVFLAPPAAFATFFRRVATGLGISEAVERRFTEIAEDWLSLKFADVEPIRLARAQEVPLLVLHDAGDDEVPFEEGEALAQAWPGARFEPTQGLGHYRVLRDHRVTRAAATFLVPEGETPDS